MDLLQTIVNERDGRAVDELGQNLGLDRDQTLAAIQHLLPALAGGMARNAAHPDGLANLEATLSSGAHERYFDQPSHLAQPEAIADGNGVLSQLFGSKDVSRQVASSAAAQTGIGADVLKKMLPMLASLVMAALARRATRSPSGNVQLNPSSAGGGLIEMLGPLLRGGQGGAGGGLGDVIGSLGGLFRR